MIQINSRVKVKDNYLGGLDDVIGRTAKVIHVHKTPPEMYNKYVLDIEGTRQRSYYSSGGQQFYTQKYSVIVNGDEIEELPYEFRDSEGNLVELGDTVVYASHGGGITKGVVVDFKDTVYPRWGSPRKELKMQVEYEVTQYYSDGNESIESRVPYITKRKQWFSNGHQTLIIEKNAVRRFLVSKDNLTLLKNN
jgi:hypothetical protein